MIRLNPSTHIFFAIIVSIIIFFIFPSIGFIELGIFFFSSFLIDFDHYLFYVFVKNDFSLKKAYKWFLVKKIKYLALPKEQRKKHYSSFCYFHGIEPVILFTISGYFFHHYFYFVAGGILFHLVLDIINEVFIYKSSTNKYSIIYTFFKKKKLKCI